MISLIILYQLVSLFKIENINNKADDISNWKINPINVYNIISYVLPENKKLNKGRGWESRGDSASRAETMVKGKLTWLQVALTRFSPKPWLAVLAVIKFRDERKMAGNLSIVADLELFLL